MYLENKKYLIGALTSKPYAFLSRSWELKVYESVDIYDNFGSNIRFDVNNLKILRILPKINKNLNENWITDKVRFCYDGLYKQRINSPLLREDNKLVPVTWLAALKKFRGVTNIKGSESGCGAVGA
jgi:NADH-quinone oxidoreductase subunit G